MTPARVVADRDRPARADAPRRRGVGGADIASAVRSGSACRWIGSADRTPRSIATREEHVRKMPWGRIIGVSKRREGHRVVYGDPDARAAHQTPRRPPATSARAGWRSWCDVRRLSPRGLTAIARRVWNVHGRPSAGWSSLRAHDRARTGVRHLRVTFCRSQPPSRSSRERSKRGINIRDSYDNGDFVGREPDETTDDAIVQACSLFWRHGSGRHRFAAATRRPAGRVRTPQPFLTHPVFRQHAPPRRDPAVHGNSWADLSLTTR